MKQQPLPQSMLSWRDAQSDPPPNEVDVLFITQKSKHFGYRFEVDSEGVFWSEGTVFWHPNKNVLLWADFPDVNLKLLMGSLCKQQ